MSVWIHRYLHPSTPSLSSDRCGLYSPTGPVASFYENCEAWWGPKAPPCVGPGRPGSSGGAGPRRFPVGDRGAIDRSRSRHRRAGQPLDLRNGQQHGGTLAALALGITFGLGTAYLIATNGLILGSVTGLALAAGIVGPAIGAIFWGLVWWRGRPTVTTRTVPRIPLPQEAASS